MLAIFAFFCQISDSFQYFNKTHGNAKLASFRILGAFVKKSFFVLHHFSNFKMEILNYSADFTFQLSLAEKFGI